jgi:hypothetical protein
MTSSSKPPLSRPVDSAPALPIESTIAPTGDSFASAAESFARTGGGFLKHDGKAGGWSYNGTPIAPDDRWAALNVGRGHKYLALGKPAEDYPQPFGGRFKPRSELPYHTDQALWPIVDGEPQDPIKAYLRLDTVRLNDGAPCSYESFNVTGRRAVMELVCTIAWQRDVHGPMAKPVLRLGSREWKSGTRSAFLPTFRIIGWAVPDGQGGMRLEATADKPTLGDQLDGDRNPY